jgi:hypothetical protein
MFGQSSSKKTRWLAWERLAALGMVSAACVAAGGTGDNDLTTRVEQRIRDWQPTRDERRLDEIGWARDIRDALELARKHGRPVFLFTYDGASLGTYRC